MGVSVSGGVGELGCVGEWVSGWGRCEWVGGRAGWWVSGGEWVSG